MTGKEIEAKAERAMIKFRVAKAIRELIDKAHSEYGDGWDDDDVETEIIELVTSDAD